MKWPIHIHGRERAARLLAVGGALVGLLGVLIGISVTGLDFVLVIKDENVEVSRTLVGMAWSLMGLLGGVMSWREPRVPGLLMAVAGVGGLVTMPAYFSAGGILLLIGAAIALSSKSDRPAG